MLSLSQLISFCCDFRRRVPVFLTTMINIIWCLRHAKSLRKINFVSLTMSRMIEMHGSINLILWRWLNDLLKILIEFLISAAKSSFKSSKLSNLKHLEIVYALKFMVHFKGFYDLMIKLNSSRYFDNDVEWIYSGPSNWTSNSHIIKSFRK